MNKQLIFFTDTPPEDKTAIHIWLGQSDLSHEHSLRSIIAQYLGSSAFQLSKGPTGKLHLPSACLHFNLSDCQEWVAIALSWQAPVGIDIEKIRPIEEMEPLICDSYAPREQAYVHAAKNGEETLVRFWQIWNRKEACLKALGLGLQDNMAQWDCSGDGWIFVNRVWVRSVPLEHPLSAAVAIVPD